MKCKGSSRFACTQKQAEECMSITQQAGGGCISRIKTRGLVSGGAKYYNKHHLTG